MMLIFYFYITAPSRFVDRPKRSWDDSDIRGYRTITTLSNYPGTYSLVLYVIKLINYPGYLWIKYGKEDRNACMNYTFIKTILL